MTDNEDKGNGGNGKSNGTGTAEAPESEVLTENEIRMDAQQGKPIEIQYIVTVRTDKSIDVTGPVDNFFLFRDIMCKAELSVLDLHMKLFDETLEQSGIMAPTDAETLAFNKMQ